MNITMLFLIYVTLFRLAIILVGVISIWLGYNLLCKGIFGKGQQTELQATLDNKESKLNFLLKNASPGVFFALFGVIIITVMLIQGSPELTLEKLNKLGSENSTQAISEEAQTTKITLRGEEKTLQELTREGIEYERQGELQKAVESYQEALTLVANPMNFLAWVYQKQGKLEEGLSLARTAVAILPENAEFIDTLAVILCKRGERTESMEFVTKAATLNPTKFTQRLENFRQGQCE